MVTAIVGAMTPTAQAGEGTTTVRDHRTSTIVRDHRTQRRNEVVVVNRPKLECVFGYESLLDQGYSFIHHLDCEGVKYLYTAVLGDNFFHAKMNAYSGDFEFTMRGFLH